MSNFNWPEMPPLDITLVARHIQQIWHETVMAAEHEARCQAECASEAGIPLPPHRWLFPIQNEVGSKIMEILKAYDEGRTRQIEFLKKELAHAHNLMPRITPLFPVCTCTSPTRGRVDGNLAVCSTCGMAYRGDKKL